MFEIPATLSGRVDLAISYAKREILDLIDRKFDRLAFGRAARDLNYAVENHFPAAYIETAQATYDEIGMAVLGQELCEDFGDEQIPGYSCWESGYNFDDNGNEVWASVIYQPWRFKFVAVRHSERGSNVVGTAITLDEAIALTWIE